MVKARCEWCGTDPLYVEYHDAEWGAPLHDPRALFELLMLEGMQAGLSWITVLRKRARLRDVFLDFFPERLAALGPADVDAALGDAGVIRHRGKIEALARNARAYVELAAEMPPERFIWSFVNDAPVQNRWRRHDQVPSTTPAAVALSKALKRRGFTFVGPTICYAFMQAGGLVNDHLVSCFRHAEVGRLARHTVS